MKRWIIAFLAAAALLLIVSAPSAEAVRQPWRVPGKYVYYYDYTGRAPVQSGMNSWTRLNTGANLYVGRTTDITRARITIRWQDLPSPNIAWAEYSTSDGYLISCHIKLDVSMKTWSWQAIRKTVNHEGGHCMGLAHTSYRWSVMSDAPDRYAGYMLTAYDKNDMIAKYGRYL